MAYTKTIWENSPSENTPISAENLQNMENGIEDVDTRLTTAEGEIDTAQTDINNAEAVIGNETDTYSASSTYALGDLVIYNSLLYKCTTAITVAEAWNSAKWTQVSLTSLANDGDVYSTSEQVIGKWIDGKPIYRKVITGTRTTTPQTIATINNAGDIISINGFMATSDNSVKLPIGGYLDVDNYSFLLFVGNDAKLYSPSTFNNGTYKAIFEYTKTTD